ncbi:MAG: 3D domain-containing protein [Lachnospiraceae bacterium]|nr:3D domain-containing protein [Lachnospiraceae bacterium]
MKQKALKALLILGAAMVIVTSTKVAVKAEKLGLFNYKEMEATAYCDEGLCYDETIPTEGITCAAEKEYIGKTFVIYDENWMLIGIYECHDTGGDYRIKNGSVVDIYMDSEDECWKFGRQKVYVQIVDAKG